MSAAEHFTKPAWASAQVFIPWLIDHLYTLLDCPLLPEHEYEAVLDELHELEFLV